jgi:hypothetical protein
MGFPTRCPFEETADMMEYKGYFGSVTFDAENDVFHGEVIGIRDVITFQGKSVAELCKAFRDSVNDYLEFCHACPGGTVESSPAGTAGKKGSKRNLAKKSRRDD